MGKTSTPLAEKIPAWSALSGLGNSRLLRTSYIWIVLGPVAANLLSGMGESPIPRGPGHSPVRPAN